MFGRVAPLAARALLSLPRVTPAAGLQPVPMTGACPPGYYSSGSISSNCELSVCVDDADLSHQAVALFSSAGNWPVIRTPTPGNW